MYNTLLRKWPKEIYEKNPKLRKEFAQNSEVYKAQAFGLVAIYWIISILTYLHTYMLSCLFLIAK
jgi:hypothetical protein